MKDLVQESAGRMGAPAMRRRAFVGGLAASSVVIVATGAGAQDLAPTTSRRW